MCCLCLLHIVTLEQVSNIDDSAHTQKSIVPAVTVLMVLELMCFMLKGYVRYVTVTAPLVPAESLKLPMLICKLDETMTACVALHTVPSHQTMMHVGF